MTTKKPSQVELYGELLTSEQQYRRDLQSIARLTPEQEQALIDRARHQDQEAGYLLVESLLPYVEYHAMRLVRYVRHSTYLDLCQIGSLAMVERLQQALAHENPVAYLMQVAKKSIGWYCVWCDGLVVKKPGNRYEKDRYVPQRLEVISADVPLPGTDGAMLADVLMDEVILGDPDDKQQERYQTLYLAVEQLTEKQREVVECFYGLHGHPEETLLEIQLRTTGKYDRRANTVNNRKVKALKSLQQQLEHENVCA
jgi:DNA-directed RNA polymerase specialized sigma subunit